MEDSYGVAGTRYVFDTNKTIRYRFPTHTNCLILDRQDAVTSEAFMVILEPGEAPPLHVHDDTEQIFYIVRGAGKLEIEGEATHFAVQPGDLVRIPPHKPHRIHCEGEEPLVYLSIDCFVDGRPKDEPTWESHVRAICKLNCWDFDRIRAKM
jgi:mannose-6-phosphate isomerase-like protein (cupin superfamily)